MLVLAFSYWYILLGTHYFCFLRRIQYNSDGSLFWWDELGWVWYVCMGYYVILETLFNLVGNFSLQDLALVSIVICCIVGLIKVVQILTHGCIVLSWIQLFPSEFLSISTKIVTSFLFRVMK